MCSCEAQGCEVDECVILSVSFFQILQLQRLLPLISVMDSCIVTYERHSSNYNSLLSTHRFVCHDYFTNRLASDVLSAKMSGLNTSSSGGTMSSKDLIAAVFRNLDLVPKRTFLFESSFLELGLETKSLVPTLTCLNSVSGFNFKSCLKLT